MGANQSVEADGNSGWLASSPFAGCCAPGNRSDEEVDPFQTNTGNGRRRSITNEQPRSLRPLLLDSARQLPRPSTGQSMRQWVGTRQVESRTPGYPHLSMRANRSKNSRPVISAPTDFRHLDGSGTALPQSAAISRPAGRPAQVSTQPAPTLRRKPNFRPLQLSIYLPDNQLSPLPDFTRNSWDKKPDRLAYPGQAHVRNRADSMCSEAPFRIPRKPIPSYVDDWFGEDGADARTIDIPLRPVVKRSSTMPMLERPRTITADLCTRDRETASPVPISGPSSPRMRSNTEPLNPSRSLRKRPSYRSPRDSVEDAINELNLIVEERRAKKSASNSPKQHHVPALAPNFKMHVRSETLSDIGSALSVPFTSKPLPSIPPSPVAEMDRDSAYDSPAIRSVSNSQTDLLTRFPTPPEQTSRNNSKGRLVDFMRRRRNNSSLDSSETLTSSKFSHTRTATDDTLNSFASSVTVTSDSPFYHGPSPLALHSTSRFDTSPSIGSTAANCPTNSTVSTPATISTFHDDGEEEEEDEENSDARSSTPDTTVSTPVAPLPAGVSPRNLSVPSFGVALERRERQGKSWSAVVEEMDDKRVESGEFLTFESAHVESDDEEEHRGRSRYSAVGVAF
ncbi:hypothetical protein B0J12DRAFT_62055 [Macrophomina phaseolina]|uniref:Uncharacterized protein n=1 Tax=Macrophomina phaseolina TaxID=35725 RepID=A0ABQ8GFI1_9PEZI|nr:hypothetical protein B0J12DRAFT_62055 [Macrophomina phaseolina]